MDIISDRSIHIERKTAMILSMTGFGRAKTESGGYEFTVEIKSVNSRFLDITCKMPKIYNRLEEKIKSLVSEYTTRGKIEIYISAEKCSDSEEELVVLNEAYLKSYLKCLRSLRNDYGLTDDISVMTVARQSDVFEAAKPKEETADELWDRLRPALIPAFEEFFGMKKTEGERLAEDILGKLTFFDGYIKSVSERVPVIVENYRERLIERIAELTDGGNLDESRLVAEVALFADKAAVDEEIVRLTSHIASLRDMLSEAVSSDKITPVGRKIDFLLQEINREINTTGSKANDAELAKMVVDAKSEAEKIREQIQNLE